MKNTKDEKIIQEFRRELQKAYKGLLPDEIIQKNEWFESFLLSKVREAREEVIEEIKKYLKGKKGITPQAKDNLREFLNELKEKEEE